MLIVVGGLFAVGVGSIIAITLLGREAEESFVAVGDELDPDGDFDPDDIEVPADDGLGPLSCPAPAGEGPVLSFPAPPAMCIDPSVDYTATIETDAGTIEIDLLEEQAPVTVNNFVFLARYRFYDGLTFHRVIPDFVIQGGDPAGDGTGGPGYQFEDELPAPEDYQAGSLAMANSGPNTNGSQFFLVTSEAGAESLVQAVGGAASYSLFGQVTEGMDVVAAIEADGTPQGAPELTHTIESVTIHER